MIGSNSTWITYYRNASAGDMYIFYQSSFTDISKKTSI